MPRASRVKIRKFKKLRRSIKRGLISNIQNKPHLFKYHVARTSLEFSTSSTTTYTSLNFHMSDVNNYAELSALFDRFKINKVVVKITPTWNQTYTPMVNTDHIIPQIMTAIDYDGKSGALTSNILREYGSCKETQGFKPHVRTIYPKLLGMTYKTAVSTAYTPIKSRYVDFEDATTPHYGLLVWMNNGGLCTTGEPWSARIECTYYISCRDAC